MPRSQSRIPLSALLLRQGILPASSMTDDFAKNATFAVWEGSSLRAIEPTDPSASAAASPGVLLLALLQRDVGPPGWELLVQEIFGLKGFASKARKSPGAIIYCSVADPLEKGQTRWIAWTFGSGSRAMGRRAVDPRFGLMVAVNRIGGSDLRQIEYQQFGAYKQRTTHRTGRDTPLDGFRMERHADLLSGVGGRADGDGLGQLFGKRSVRSRDGICSPEDLMQLAESTIASYRDRAYLDEYSFIDDYVLVDDERLIDELRDQLTEDILEDRDNVDVFIPDDLVAAEYERAIHYILFPDELARKASRLNLTLGDLRRKFLRFNVDVLDWDLRFCDTQRKVIDHASVLDCLVADLTLSSGQYVVADGQVLKVSQSFIDRLNQGLDALNHTALNLPCYLGGIENKWILDAKELQNSFVCLHGQRIYVDGETPFEPADLVHESGALIHAKRKGCSSALSYVFVQASRSCQFLAAIPEACDQIRQEIKAQALDDAAGERILEAFGALDSRHPMLEVVIAILGDWRGRSLRNLPLLSKVELLGATKRISQLGFAPTVSLVGLCDSL